MKIFTLLNGGFYVLFGLYGAFMPKGLADLMGWTPDLLGHHEIRATFMAIAALGVMALIICGKIKDQRPMVLCFIGVTLALASGRLLGLLLDGYGPVQTYYELGFETIWALLGFILYRRGTRLIA
ncbi:MAG: DUF4345 family protein [Maricaulaceae bacterium]